MKKVVTIGGGTGSYVILRGIRSYPIDITAVVSMFDSGGSTGLLRDEFGVLPPGDVRRCLIALSEGHNEEILRNLFGFRFNGGTGLNGHNFGNLFIVALASIYGSDIEAIKKASELLNIKGRVLPVSLDTAHVHAILEDGTEIVGETNIDVPKHNGDLKITELLLKPDATLYKETREAIEEADLIVFCPGDLYTSLLPNFLVKGIAEALQKSKAKKALVCPLMTKWGETNGFKASDFARTFCEYTGLEKFDHVICNTRYRREELIEAYAKEKKEPVEIDPENLTRYSKDVIIGDFVSESDLARHDSDKVAAVLAQL